MSIHGNRNEDVMVAAELVVPFDGVCYSFTADTIDGAAWPAVIAYPGDVSDAQFLFAGNDIRAFAGVDMGSRFGEDVWCRIVGNRVSYDERCSSS